MQILSTCDIIGLHFNSFLITQSAMFLQASEALTVSTDKFVYSLGSPTASFPCKEMGAWE